MKKSTTIYLTNKELLSEIHTSKMTYVQIDDPMYYFYDVIVYDLDVFLNDEVCTYHTGEWEVVYIPPKKKKEDNKKMIFEENINDINITLNKETPKTKIINNLYAWDNHKDAPKRIIISKTLLTPKTSNEYITEIKQAKAKKLNKQGADPKITAEDIFTGDLVIRYMTYDHIPKDENWNIEKEKKKTSDGFTKVFFPPFQIFVLENGVPRCVGLSHYKNNKFNQDYGRTTEKLGKMYIKMVEKISKKGSFRNYTYLDEMKASALVQLSQVGLLFDEGRSQNPNPFAFYTTVVTNVFKRVLNTEKRTRDIRDDLIEMAGQSPSHSRQSETEWNASIEAAQYQESALYQKRHNRLKNN